MTTLNHTESMPRFLHLRAYLAGAGATGALIAGAAIVLLSLATFLAFSGLPFGASAGDSGNAYLRHGSGAPATTAASLAGAPGAVAARPAAGGGGSSSAPGPSGASAGASGGGATQSTGPTSTTGSTPSPGCTTGCSEAPSQPGPVTNAVQGADDTLGTDLSGSTEGLTGRVDDTVRGTLNDAGGAVGSPGLGDQVTHLGDQVTQTGNRLAGGLLPPGG
jgi:hypothetical protein